MMVQAKGTSGNSIPDVHSHTLLTTFPCLPSLPGKHFTVCQSRHQSNQGTAGLCTSEKHALRGSLGSRNHVVLAEVGDIQNRAKVAGVTPGKTTATAPTAAAVWAASGTSFVDPATWSGG
eukprot:m.753854 g.753854  ORF g.753854 m.753854 type:complete len:120 (-) comp23174_c1_seq4:3241-3600(-)